MKKTALVACLLALGGVMATTGALAQDTADGIAEYRAMLGEGGNPAELTEMAREDLWFET